MALSVRPAMPDDAEIIERLNSDVQALHAAALPALFKPPSTVTLPATEVRGLLHSPNVRILLAMSDGEPVGYAFAEIRRNPGNGRRFARDLVYLHHLCVQPASQRRGIGSALMDAVRLFAAEHNIEDLELDVWTFNERARRFFHQQGFASYNERMWNGKR